jgi:hypothetical protein
LFLLQLLGLSRTAGASILEGGDGGGEEGCGAE